MPLTYHIYQDDRILFIQGDGVIAQHERIQSMFAWINDRGYEHCADALCDFSAAESTPTVSDLRELTMLLANHLPVRGPKKLAIVTPKPIAYGMARVFEDLVRGNDIPLQIRVFAGRAEAWAWLRPATSPA
jgi:hypothetical protein